MAFSSKHIPVDQTRSFSTLVVDYLSGNEDLRAFYSHSPDLNGIAAAIKERKEFSFDRELLYSQLKKQYESVETLPQVKNNLQLLAGENTFTVCTAHQPNLFTGHLYFVYKILHAVSLAEYLAREVPGNNFVPVFYMGSEDADLAELGSIEIGGMSYTWNTEQKGAVGRMKVDNELIKLIDQISGQVSVLPFGKEIVSILRDCYETGRSIEDATFRLVNSLFGRFGVVVLLPDNTAFKGSFKNVIEKELQDGFSAVAVEDTLRSFPGKYKVQAGGREINLFYLEEDSRERIERSELGFKVNNRDKVFSESLMAEELHNNPERFSPNVILRPVFQEWILPNVAFIGGGGEMAYWLELKNVFQRAGVPFPVLVLRNSFLVIRKRWKEMLEKWKVLPEDVFLERQQFVNRLVAERSAFPLALNGEKVELEETFDKLSTLATAHDTALQNHVLSIKKGLLKKLDGLEKKMYRAARKKEESLLSQVNSLYADLFPNGVLQERVENIIPYYATYGPGFLDVLLENSGGLDQDFTILMEE